MTDEMHITLWGGPKHGEMWTIIGGVDRFIIMGMPNGEEAHVHFDPKQPVGAMLNLRRGVYTQVGETLDFEWIGWEKR